MIEIAISTQKREQLLPITRDVQDVVLRQSWESGAVLVFCPHTTAGLTINEAADPDVQLDMRHFMNTLIPNSPSFLHAEGNSDAHIKTSLFGSQLFVIVERGKLRLGTWQGLYFCEWDGPRDRQIWIQFLPSE